MNEHTGARLDKKTWWDHKKFSGLENKCHFRLGGSIFIDGECRNAGVS